ncbi:MAG: hypothetical protein IT426_07735 [Pirellulales bacterium]|nr:hypothetical protein [Pirellulales bacterium]
MTHFATRICSGFLCGWLIVAGAAQAQKEQPAEKSSAQTEKVQPPEGQSAEVSKIPPAESLFPKSTQGFISIANVESLIEHFNNTQLGKLTADPVMKPFTEDVKRQFENRWSSVHERLGVTLDDLRDVPGGEVGIGLIEPAKKQSAIAITVDITGRHEQAQAMLEKINKNLTADGAKRTELKAPNFPEPIIQFLLPLREEEREAEGTRLGGQAANSAVPAGQAPPARYAYYFTSGNFLCTTDNLDVLHGILARFAGKGAAEDALAGVPGFKMAAARCAADAGEAAPQIRWFIHPIGYAAVARAATPPEQRRRGKSLLELMQNQGFAAIKGVGGFASFDAESYDLVHRTAVFAPKPYEKSMKMLKFLNGEDYTPQTWVPRDISTYSTFYFDILNAFDNFGPMFDELYGGGEEGIWIDTLKSLEEDPHGPKINLRKELIELLDRRITVLTDYQLPITTSSERIVVAIQVKEGKEKEVAKGIEKSMKGDPSAKPRTEGELLIWEIVEQEGPAPEAPQVEGIGDEPTFTPPKKKLIEGEERLFPHMAITVSNGQLFVASHIDVLLKVLKPYEPREQLRNDADYRLVSETIGKMRPKDKCAGVFSRTDEACRPTYEMIRQNKMPESESMLGRLLNQLFGEGKKGQPRKHKLDGSQLPEYDAVRRYLSPAGLQATAEEDGWFIKGFTVGHEALTGEAPKAEPKKEAPKAATKEETPKAATKEETPKAEPKEEAKPAPAAEAKEPPKAKTEAPKTEAEEPKAKTKEQPKAESKEEPKQEPEAQPRETPKAEEKKENR